MNETAVRADELAEDVAEDMVEDFSLDAFIPYMLNQVFSQMNVNMRHVLRPFGVSIHQWRVLCLLKLRGEISVGEIVDSTVMGQSTVSRVLDQLERDGHAVRRPQPKNNRVILVTLTDEGEAAIDQIFPAAISVHDGAINRFEPDEQQKLFSLLHRMLANLRQEGALQVANGTLPLRDGQ